jgi:hypothetical protein
LSKSVSFSAKAFCIASGSDWNTWTGGGTGGGDGGGREEPEDRRGWVGRVRNMIVFVSSFLSHPLLSRAPLRFLFVSSRFFPLFTSSYLIRVKPTRAQRSLLPLLLLLLLHPRLPLLQRPLRPFNVTTPPRPFYCTWKMENGKTIFGNRLLEVEP